MTPPNLQRMQEGCRRLLAAVSVSWGHPEGWSFRVLDEEDAGWLKLIATYRIDRQVYDMKLAFPYEEIIDRYDEQFIQRKVLQMYRDALRGIGRST